MAEPTDLHPYLFEYYGDSSGQATPQFVPPRQASNNTAEGKGKRAGNSEGAAQWSTNLTEAFLAICMEEVKNGNVNGGCLSNIGYDNLSKKFLDKTGVTYKRIQFKNKWDKMKKEWGLWSAIGNATGGGWDSSRNTWARSDEWWASWIERFLQSGKFQRCGLQYKDELQTLFEGKVAVGKGISIPSSSVQPPNGELNADILDDATYPVRKDTATFESLASFPKRKKAQVDVKARNNESSKLIDLLEEHNLHREHMFASREAATNSDVKKCMEELNALGYQKNEPVRVFGLAKLTRDVDARRSFLIMDDIDDRKSWLEFEFQFFKDNGNNSKVYAFVVRI